jgi:hypothetical protein
MTSSTSQAKLVLTYDSATLTDGVGAQLQRIYGTYSIARHLGVSYLHSPLSHVGYQGLSALEANRGDPDFHHQFNELCHLTSDVLPPGALPTISLPNIYLDDVHDLIARFDRGATDGMPTLARLVVPYGIADQVPDCYDVCKDVSPFTSSPRRGRAVRVAVHVRGGEQVVMGSGRLLPHRYYVNVALGVARVLEALNLEYRIELWTEVPTGDFVVRPNHHGIDRRITAPVAAGPEMFGLDEFSVLPNLVHCINGTTIDCLRNLATADILVMSRSSFSYVAAILNRAGVILYHPFWHSPLSSWVTVGADGEFDPVQLSRAMAEPRNTFARVLGWRNRLKRSS